MMRCCETRNRKEEGGTNPMILKYNSHTHTHTERSTYRIKYEKQRRLELQKKSSFADAVYLERRRNKHCNIEGRSASRDES